MKVDPWFLELACSQTNRQTRSNTEEHIQKNKNTERGRYTPAPKVVDGINKQAYQSEIRQSMGRLYRTQLNWTDAILLLHNARHYHSGQRVVSGSNAPVLRLPKTQCLKTNVYEKYITKLITKKLTQ